MISDNGKFYYSPHPDSRIYENCMKKATFLVENGYVKITLGYTFETLMEQLLDQEVKNQKIINTRTIE